MEIKQVLHKSPFKRSFRNGIHSFLSRTDARGFADTICDAYR